jgi:hypothetical protein
MAFYQGLLSPEWDQSCRDARLLWQIKLWKIVFVSSGALCVLTNAVYCRIANYITSSTAQAYTCTMYSGGDNGLYVLSAQYRRRKPLTSMYSTYFHHLCLALISGHQMPLRATPSVYLTGIQSHRKDALITVRARNVKHRTQVII